MKTYEVAVVARGGTGDEAQKKMLADITGMITKLEGKVTNIESWPKRLLTYDIAKEREAYYHFFSLTLSPSNTIKLRDKLKLQESLLRYLIVSMTKKEIAAKTKEQAKETVSPA